VIIRRGIVFDILSHRFIDGDNKKTGRQFRISNPVCEDFAMVAVVKTFKILDDYAVKWDFQTLPVPQKTGLKNTPS
jgi:hypothetical protein